MVLFISVIILILGIILLVIDKYKRHKYESLFFTGLSLLSVSIVAVLVSICILIGNYSTCEADVAANEQLYNSLVYKAENKDIRDEFGIVNKSYIDEVEDWNVDLARNKKIQDNFWVGVFFPNIYDQFEFIDIEKIVYKE